MSEKLPDGWVKTEIANRWRHVGGASAEIYRIGAWFSTSVSGPDRTTKEEAEQDRLNLISGLEGGADLRKAREQIDTLTARLDRASERHDAIVECLDAIRAPQEATIPERVYAWRNGVQAIIAAADRERDVALARVADFERTLSETVCDHYSAQERIADLARQLEEKSALHRGALTLVQRLREERSGLRDIIDTQEHQIDGLKAAACDVAPQLLRDSMRVTQEENVRIKADMARKDAEIAALRQRVAASEAYAQHLLAALNAVSGFKGMP